MEQTLLASSSTAPFTVTLTNLAAGRYSLTAKASVTNTTLTSAAVLVTVVNSVTSTLCSGVAGWNSATIYSAPGAKVTYQGRLYQNTYWTQGNAPVTPYVLGAPWKDLGVCGAGQGRIGTDNGPAELGSTNGIMLHPNPTDGLLTVEFYVNEANTQVQFNIVDLTGKRVYLSRGTFVKGNQKKTIQLPNLAPQLYLLQVTTGAGRRLGTQKFIYTH